jgi:hypothetical protein
MRDDKASILRQLARRNAMRASVARRTGNDDLAGYYQDRSNRFDTQLSRLDDDYPQPQPVRGRQQDRRTA